jgi:hypothetical protein
MIELIFAIVIMGIVLMSAPTLMSTSEKSTSTVIQQEGINQAVSRIAMILTYPWDENDANSSCIPPVLRVTHGASALEPLATDPTRRAGVPKSTKTRKFNTCGKELNASSLGPDPGDSGKDDIDDFQSTTLSTIQNAGGRYLGKDSANIATTIAYGTDTASYGNGGNTPIVFNGPTAATPTTNIKKIDVTVTTFGSDAELSNSITMHAFSCNIGGVAYETKRLP